MIISISLGLRKVLKVVEVPLWDEEIASLEVASQGIKRRLKELLPG